MLRCVVFTASIVCVALTMLPSVARAESPACEFFVETSSITSDAPDCIRVNVSACYNALEGSLENFCTAPVVMKDWPNTNGDVTIEPDGSHIFVLLVRPDTDEDPYVYDLAHTIETDGASFPVQVTATIKRWYTRDGGSWDDTSDDGGCSVLAPPAAPTRTPWAVALTLGLFVSAGMRRRMRR